MPLAVAIGYLGFGLTWIFCSDRLLSFARLDPERTLRVQTYKGWAFVVASAALIYFALRWYARRHTAALVELEASEGRIRASEEGHRVALQVTNDAMWDYDATRDTMRWNDGLTRLFGYTPEAVTPTLAWLLERIHPQDSVRLSTAKEDIASLDGSFTRGYRFQKYDGSYAHIVDRGHAFRDHAGALRRVIGGMTDVTHLIEAEQQIRTTNNQLEQRVEERTQQLESANRELEAFAYAVSHDLRAPLRSISGFSQALRETTADTLDSKTAHYLQRIQDASAKMSHLIDDLLQLSRIERSDMAPRSIDLTQMFNQCVATMTERYPGHAVHTEIEPEMGAHGDPRLLSIAIENLIDNAWKYTRNNPHAQVKIGQSTVNGERCFFVSDNGVGFNMAYAGKLFAPFQRLHSDVEFPGTGIGLCTVHRILRRHGGRIWAESQVNLGTTFRFTLPRSGREHSA
jgi:PAS domain S-box-containing protein